MAELWTPGMAGPHDDLVARIHRRIEAFSRDHGVEAMVEVGALRRRAPPSRSRISADPGYGFVTSCPQAPRASRRS